MCSIPKQHEQETNLRLVADLCNPAIHDLDEIHKSILNYENATKLEKKRIQQKIMSMKHFIINIQSEIKNITKLCSKSSYISYSSKRIRSERRSEIESKYKQFCIEKEKTDDVGRSKSAKKDDDKDVELPIELTDGKKIETPKVFIERFHSLKESKQRKTYLKYVLDNSLVPCGKGHLYKLILRYKKSGNNINVFQPKWGSKGRPPIMSLSTLEQLSAVAAKDGGPPFSLQALQDQLIGNKRDQLISNGLQPPPAQEITVSKNTVKNYRSLLSIVNPDLKPETSSKKKSPT